MGPIVVHLGVMISVETLQALEQAIALDSQNHILRLHLAEMYAVCEQPAKAWSHCQQLLRQVPGHEGALALVRRLPVFSDCSSECKMQPVPSIGGTLLQFANKNSLLIGKKFSHAKVEHPTVRLADVGGLSEVKRRLQLSFLGPLQNPVLRQMYAKSLRGGLLLWGPPGCGKTFLAKALAGEVGAQFLSVGFEEVLGVWQGESEKNLHDLFEQARRQAPCVLFLDEVDALGHKRSQLRGSEGRNLVVQLLTELDGVGQTNEGVFVLAATNQPWDVDPALRRPGRLDRMMLVLPPDVEARRDILRYHLREKPVGSDVQLEPLAQRSSGFSGADLAQVCETAAEYALEHALQTGTPRPIYQADLENALMGTYSTITAWLHLAKTYAEFSSESGVYDDLLAYLRTSAV